ncbi:MAG: hypothetical protein CVU08_14625 [Bacteroidetes bacterium HGW-Bacteroidetes-3]|jgi:hypothetical protein|nr:MAG: hypothetical protein CVU08_14625 [Bacteroidetes bacterium HGW-Bacteroidetes-3]
MNLRFYIFLIFSYPQPFPKERVFVFLTEKALFNLKFQPEIVFSPTLKGELFSQDGAKIFYNF